MSSTGRPGGVRPARAARLWWATAVLVLVVAGVFGVACGDGGARETEGTEPTIVSSSASDERAAETSTSTPTAQVPSPALIAARPYRLVEPTGGDRKEGAPLIVVLHGYGQGADFHEYFELDPVVTAAGALVAYPLGTPDGLGRRFWNASEVCCDFFERGIDDVAYLEAVIDDVASQRAVDPKRVYVVGYSNGAFMAQRLACELSDRVAAIVSVAGVNVADEGECQPSERVSVLQVHGDADPVVHYLGGRLGAGTAEYPSVLVSIEGWRERNGCERVPEVRADTLDVTRQLPGAETSITGYEGCAGGGATELWTVHGGDHDVDFAPAFAREVWAFLERNAKP